MSKKKKIIIAVIIAILAIAIIVGIVVAVKMNGKSAAADSGVYAQKVSDVMYSSGTVDKYSGVVEAADSLDIKTDAEKTVKDILVAEGDEVQVGTPLFTYDTDELSAKRDSAALELEGLNNTLSGYDAQITQLTNEKKSASKDQQLDYTLQIQQVQTQQKQTQYDIASKQAEIAKYDESINNATVTSTMVGMVKKINENQSADQSDSAFMTIISTGDYRVKGTIDEQSYYYSGLSEGMSVIVRSRVDDTKTWMGTISKVDTENPQKDNNNGYYSDDSSTETASKYNFYIQLASSEDMLLGQHVFIEPDYGQSEIKEGIWIDESYIVQDDGDAYVWVMNSKNKLEKRTVELGDYDADLAMYEIKSGLSEDDYIVWASDDLYEGEAAQTWEEYLENGGGDEMIDDGMFDTSVDDEMLYDTEGGSFDEEGMTDEGMVDDGSMDDGAVDDGSAEAEVQ
ncbi:efflux RND transporter periplasmic adaptor subunit [Agathobacter sp.]